MWNRSCLQGRLKDPVVFNEYSSILKLKCTQQQCFVTFPPLLVLDRILSSVGDESLRLEATVTSKCPGPVVGSPGLHAAFDSSAAESGGNVLPCVITPFQHPRSQVATHPDPAQVPPVWFIPFTSSAETALTWVCWDLCIISTYRRQVIQRPQEEKEMKSLSSCAL